MVVGTLDERPDEGWGRRRRSDRIAQRRPSTSVHAIHDECRVIAVEQERLVAQIGELRQGVVLGIDDPGGTDERLVRG
ncbi:hypothetical protein RZS08_15055, partial [Arthrospira platensis SPKY1]|nr:hypothetical protein [Arthrospira platensis SPKY1]